MKQTVSVFLALVITLATHSAVFAEAASGEEQLKNVQTGARNVSTGWVEVLDATSTEAAKGTSTGEHLTGVVAGGAIGVRKAIHRVGAGAIDLITFWIPKKEPLINPETARLE